MLTDCTCTLYFDLDIVLAFGCVYNIQNVALLHVLIWIIRMDAFLKVLDLIVSTCT